MLTKNRQELIESFRDRCKQHNLNITPQRVAIYEELMKSKDHPDSEDIFERVKIGFPDMSLDTVYRTLSKFAEIGLAHLVEGYGESKRYDPDTNKHHHFRCQKCNKIVDFHDADYDNLRIARAIRNKFRVTNVKVVLEGTCDECAGNK
ncbi:MAG: transcriptional repressor [Phycisphaerales bacterium]|jgi:Fur family peroxide stress response transcriptional regulator